MPVPTSMLPVVLGPAAVLLAFVIARARRLRQHGRDVQARRLLTATLTAWLLALLLVTTVGVAPQPFRYFQLVPFGTGTRMHVEPRELVTNALLFVPLGLLLPLLARRPVLTTVLSALVLSGLVETGQYAAAVGRSADITDVILNTLGATAAAILAHLTYARPARGDTFTPAFDRRLPTGTSAYGADADHRHAP